MLGKNYRDKLAVWEEFRTACFLELHELTLRAIPLVRQREVRN